MFWLYYIGNMIEHRNLVSPPKVGENGYNLMDDYHLADYFKEGIDDVVNHINTHIFSFDSRKRFTQRDYYSQTLLQVRGGEEYTDLFPLLRTSQKVNAQHALDVLLPIMKSYGLDLEKKPKYRVSGSGNGITEETTPFESTTIPYLEFWRDREYVDGRDEYFLESWTVADVKPYNKWFFNRLTTR